MTNSKQTSSRTSKDATVDHVLKYIGVLGGVHGLKMLVMLARNKLASILLHKEGVGVNAVYGNISDLIYNATNLGLSFSTVRNLSELFETGTEQEKRDFVCVIRTWAILTALLSSFVCLAGSFLLDNFFFDGDRHFVLPICLLSVYLFTLPIEAVECSIIKGMRRLKSLAMVEILVLTGTFATSIPLYYFMHIDGIIIALIISGLLNVVVHLSVTLRMFPWRIHLLDKDVLKRGLPLFRLGIPYVLAGIIGALSLSLVYNVLQGLDEIGLYRQGVLIMTISSALIFSAMDSDYFPRLSTANHDIDRMNKMANQQIMVNVLLMTPMLIVMVLLMPHLIRLIASDDFIAIAPMVIFGIFHLLFKAVSYPISYFPLAKGDTLIFMLMELIYDSAFVGLVWVCYRLGSFSDYAFDSVRCGGLVGTGIAFALANLLELLIVGFYYGKRYGFRMFRSSMMLAFSELLLLSICVPFSLLGGHTIVKYCIGLVALCGSLLLVWRLLSSQSDIVKRIKNRLAAIH